MIVIVMGVSGCGKTTVGQALAASLGWGFFDADDYHPEGNIRKMADGVPLTDEDRKPWLDRLRNVLAAEHAEGRSVVLACSALKNRYRDVLRAAAPDVRFVYLRGTFDEILQLISRRKGHFMKPGMLQSQFEALEEPGDAISVPVLLTVTEQVALIRRHLTA